MWVRSYLSSSLGKKSLMAVSGSFLVLFLLVHLIGNSTTFWGRSAFNNYAAHLHSLGIVVHLFEAVLVFFFLTHIITGGLLYFENLQARPRRYAVAENKERRLATRLMPYTGLLTLIFLLIHLSNFRLVEGEMPIADAVRQLLRRPGFALFYMTAMVGVGFHLCHGLWSMLQSLGLNHPKYNFLLEKGAITMGTLVATIFFLIPLLAMLVDGFLQ